jgi:transcriptional regulator with XRE-family HTH domain
MVYNKNIISIGKRDRVNDLGDFLKELRGELSLRDVQEGTGISHTYLSTLEKGYDPRTKKERKPTPKVLQTLARFYRVNYKDLMYLAGYLENDDSLPSEEKAAKIREINLKLKELERIQEILSKDRKDPVIKKADSMFKQKLDNRQKKDKDVFDLSVLLEMDVDLYYKNKLLTKNEKEKIKTLLKTVFE